jgi:hypothetical protein
LVSRWLYIERRKVGLVSSGIGLVVAVTALVVLLAGPSAAATQTSRGFVTYRVDVTLPSGQHSVLVNETVGQSSKPGFSDLILQLSGSQQNLTYTRLVNSSTSLFPYLSSLTTQSFDYANGTTSSLHANFSAAGTTSVVFQGIQYTLSVYSFAVSGSYRGLNLDANGTLETFPTSLVYSATAGNGTAIVGAVLVATDLQLAQPPSQTSAAAYVGAGVGAGGIALAALFLVRRKERKVPSQEQKQPHWVD